MSEDFQWEDDFKVEELAERFDAMIRSDSDTYFDSEEFEMLIEYFQMTLNDEKARLALRISMEMHPYNHRLKIMSARQMAADGKFINALSLLDEIATTEPSDVDILLTKGSVYSMMLDFNKAVAEYEKALVIVDEDEIEDIYSTIAFEYENMGAFDSALNYLFKALEISDFPEQLLFEIGMCYEMASKLEESVVFFTGYIDKNPESIASWFNLGLSYHHLELYEKAVDAFEFAIAIDETYLPAYTNMAQTYVMMGNLRKAIELYHESETIESADALTLCYLGECHEKLQEYDEALQYYNKALEMDEFLPDAWAGQSVVYYEMGKVKQAITCIEKALEIDSLNTEFHLIAADYYIKLEKFEKAKAHFMRIEELDPFDQDLWLEYSNMYFLMDNKEKAIQIIKTGLIHQPKNASLFYRLVALLILNKGLIQALYFLESALELDVEAVDELFEYLPSARENTKIFDLILHYKMKNLLP